MKTRLLFVCLGNICRSPAAHGVMLHLLEKHAMLERFEVDSAGTSAHHEGEMPDERMRSHALRRGLVLDSLSRPFKAPSDFENFDLILAMDFSNFYNLEKLVTSPEQRQKLRLMSDFFESFDEKEVPDPYFGGDEGFELVLDMVTEGCEQILERYGRD